MVPRITATTAHDLIARLRAAAGSELHVWCSGFDAHGETGSDGGPGLWAAVRVFTRERPEWSVVDSVSDLGGSVLLSRDAAMKPKMASGVTIAWNYAKTKFGEMFRGRKLVPLEVAESRLDACAVCPYRNNTRCTLCGCYLDLVPEDEPVGGGAPGKAHLAAQTCPVGKWSQWPGPRTTASTSDRADSETP